MINSYIIKFLHKKGMREPLLETDDAKQKALFDQIYQSVLKTHIEKIEERLIKNGTGFLVGNSVSL